LFFFEKKNQKTFFNKALRHRGMQAGWLLCSARPNNLPCASAARISARFGTGGLRIASAKQFEAAAAVHILDIGNYLL